jgi:hypothetical protein
MRIHLLCLTMLLVSVVADANEVDQQLKELSRLPASYETAVKWFKLSKKIEDDGLRQEVLKAAGAAVLYAKRETIYAKRIRESIQDIDRFESECFEPCTACGGTGKQDKPCPKCKGDRRCTMPFCRKGMVVVKRTSSMSFVKCDQCNGTGRCKNCSGNGSVRVRCSHCGGEKKRAKIGSLLDVYRNHADLAARWNQVEEREKRERKKAEEHAKAEASRLERERKQAEERAKAEASRLERERKQAEESAKAEAARLKREREERERKAKKEFAERCEVTGLVAEVNYDGVGYASLENTGGEENFVVYQYENCPNGNAYSYLVFSTVALRNSWYASVEECTEKLKSWIRISAANQVKNVMKEIPLDRNKPYAHANAISRGKGQRDLFVKAIREPYGKMAWHPIKFIGSVEASDDKFTRYSVSIQMQCVDLFSSEIFSADGTIEEIDNRIAELLTFVNPDMFENARKAQSKKEDLFK